MDKNLLQKAKVPMIALIQTKNIMKTNNLKTKTKRTFAALLLFALLAPTAVWAQFGGGSGTETNPYIISTTDHLDQLAANVNSGMEYQNVYFKLMDDLDYTGKTYTPIGNSYWEGGSESYHKFFGIFNGNNHSINNVTIYSEGNYCGLFGCVGWGGKIHNLTLGGQSTITAVGFAGGIAGWVDNAEIIGCNVGENVVISVHPIANNYSTKPGDFGGIVGESGGKVKDCISRATVSNGGIGKTKNIGGIAGSLYDNLMEDCFFLGVVDATGSTNYVGDILGELSESGQLVSNYYHTSNRHGGVDGNDTDNAKWMGTISCVSPVSGYGTLYVFNDGTTRCFGANSFTWVVLNYNVEEGYLPCGITYMANDTIPLTNPNGNSYPLTMPDDDVVITGTVEAIKRDIGYSDWVSITIPEQDYTGEPLTPVVTVVDNKDGVALTLEEGTHYTVTLPDGGCVIPGYHTITITGMGDFAGQTTKTFTILNPGSGTEEDPYIIRNTEQMDGLAASVNGGDSKSGQFFRLEADLDYTGKTYTRIGTYGGAPFSGTFDGNGHTISHVTLNENKNFMGLFGYSRGTVKNLTLDHSSIHAERKGTVGGIVGFCDGGTVTGCYVTENVSISATEEDLFGMVHGGDDVGGIVGYAYYCTVSNCMNFAEVSGVKYVGGVAGRNNNSTVTNNYYAGNSTVGGIGYLGSNSGSDVEGQAQRGYAIEPQQPLGISLEGSIGVFYDGKVYAGENQEAIVGFEVIGSSIVPQCLNLSAGTYNDNGDDTYTITMPAEDITVSGNIVEQFGMFYEIPCNGDTTATLIHDDSYATIDAASVEDFEYQGTQYTVTEIAANAFDGCAHLKWFDCHANLLSISDHAFRNCDSLEYFGFYHIDTPPTVGTGCFDGLDLDTLMLMVPFCSRYEYAIHPVWGQFGEIQPDGVCEYNFIGMEDTLWSNLANWHNANYEPCTALPGEGAQVGIMSDCKMDADVTVGSITIGNYYDEEYGYYERLTVKDGATLTATSFIYNSGDARNFVIEDGAQVVQPNAGAQATVEKNITAYTPNTKDGYHLIGHSFADNGAVTEMTNLLANDYDLYYYDEPTHYWMNQKLTANNFTELEAAKGYLYANSASQTIGLKGTLNAANAMVNIPLSYEANALKGFNLVGNPFAHNVTTFAGTNVDTEVYRMNGTKDNVVVSEISETNPLTPGEGFFVKATGENASITFNAQTRGGAKATELAEVSTITLNLTQNGLLVDRFILKRDGEPLEKFTLNENGTRIYATHGGKDYAVATIVGVGRDGVHTVSTEVSLNFKAAKNGTYTLTFDTQHLDLEYLHLIDNLTGADIDLLTPAGFPPYKGGQGGLNQPSYTFTAKTTDYASRFRLVFSEPADETSANRPFAYIADGEIRINEADARGASLQVVDMTGRVIVTKDVARNVSTIGMTPGVYVLRLIDGDNVRTQKIVID